MEHIPLTLFSVSLQAAVGIMLFVVIGSLLGKDKVFKSAIVVAAVLGVVGMLASVIHVGRPLSAVNALFQFSTSWLSREIWFTGIFVGLTCLAAILLLVKPASKQVVTALAYGAALVGLIDVFIMATIYSSTSVLAWKSIATYVDFYATAISLGGMLFLVLSIKEAVEMRNIVILSVAIAVAVQAVTVVPYLISLGSNASVFAQSSFAILSDMAFMNVLKWVTILAGVGISLWMSRNEASKAIVGTIYGSAALLIIGQSVGRYLFYAIMVLPQVGLS